MGIKRKILIVDDEPGFTRMVKFNLESMGGYDVKVENHGTHALETTVEFMPDLILLDVIMPDTEGPDILSQIRKNDKVKHIPIIFLTATITKEEAESEEGYIGGHMFIAKPGTIEDLINCIEQELNDQPG